MPRPVQLFTGREATKEHGVATGGGFLHGPGSLARPAGPNTQAHVMGSSGMGVCLKIISHHV